MRWVKEDMTGRKFGLWTVLRFDESSFRPVHRWICVCECGTERSVILQALKKGRSKSCGCVIRSITLARPHLKGTPIYGVWGGIKARCLNKRHKHFKSYGGRGIRICYAISSSPLNLIDAVGEKPNPGMSIDRKDNDGHYSCGACDECKKMGWENNLRWATAKQQGRNRRDNLMVSVNGNSVPLAEAAELTGIGYWLMQCRIRRGISGESLFLPAGELPR